MRKEHIEYEHQRYSHFDDEVKSKLLESPNVLNMYQHYSLCHIKEDIDLALEIIRTEYPLMSDSVAKTLAGTDARFTNMFVMERSLFDAYCDFLFNVFSKMEEKKNFTENKIYLKGSFHSRIFGFLAERLFSIYFDYQLEN